jgi:hypothetical protein
MSLDKYDNFVENASASTVFSVLGTTGTTTGTTEYNGGFFGTVEIDIVQCNN